MNTVHLGEFLARFAEAVRAEGAICSPAANSRLQLRTLFTICRTAEFP